MLWKARMAKGCGDAGSCEGRRKLSQRPQQRPGLAASWPPLWPPGCWDRPFQFPETAVLGALGCGWDTERRCHGPGSEQPGPAEAGEGPARATCCQRDGTGRRPARRPRKGLSRAHGRGRRPRARGRLGKWGSVGVFFNLSERLIRKSIVINQAV